MDDLLFARLQMGLSLAFHIVFAAIGMGMPVLMALAEWRWLRTGDGVYRELAKRWAKGTAVFFAVGAVSGTVLSFELGLLWPGFMEHAGGIIGMPFGLEGFAFFTEAIFLGIYLYAWDRIGKWAHWWSGVVVAVSGSMSAVFIIMVNGWMNAPRGFDYDAATGEFSNIDPVAAMFNANWGHQAVHMVFAAWAAVGFGVAGVHALRMLRGHDSVFHRRALAIAMTVAIPSSLAMPITGDIAASRVAKTQPAKLAAMEGHFETQTRAPLVIGGIPFEKERETKWAIRIPGMLSFLAFKDIDAEVTGLDAFPEDEWPPVAITHIAFQLMVACGLAMVFVSLWFLVDVWRRKGLAPRKWLLRGIVFCAPLGFLAIEFGWTVTEVGRQPWVIYEVMRTSESVTPMPGLVAPFATFTLLYIVLAVIVTAIMVRIVRGSDERGEEAARA
ncbi:MAG: cytochrome ubiquinol oxidase subunit I [Planctomycetota bacterium]|nr:cytochrome ubiquinol oxidase subunit I [Planctomycetota bacterium]